MLDALLTLAEPGGVTDPDTALRTATSGTVVDHAGARPFSVDLAPDRLYGWLLEDRHVVWELGDPPSERENFSFALLYVAESDEQAASRRSRGVSEAMDAKAEGYLAAIAAGRSSASWEEISGGVDRAVVTGFSVRGIGLRVDGWRYRPT